MPRHILATVILLFSLPATGAHVHGEGRLDVAIDRDTLTLNLELPLDAATGFERAPNTAREKAALAAATRVLEAVPFLPTPAARCTLQSQGIGMPDFGVGGHTDIEASYNFRCSNPAALKSLETTLFQHFKRLYRVEVRRAGPGSQGAARLTAKKPGLSW